MKEVYYILQKMKARPAMWTGEYSLKSMKTFLDGYFFALYDNGLVAEDSNTQPSFHDWIAKKLGFYESTPGWHNMILAVAIGLQPNKVNWNWDTYHLGVTQEQHIESIRLFYEWYEEFMHEYYGY